MADTPNTPAGSGRTVESASAAPGEKRSASRPQHLARAAESGDPAVHQLLAERQTAQMNLATHKAAAEESREALEGHEEKVKAADDALAELGYE
jgi:hypothetical protein